MKYLISLFAIAASSVMAQTTVNVSVTLSDTQVWALTQDWQAYQDAGRGTNGVTTNTLTKLQWFQSNATNQILAAADRRVAIHRNELLGIIVSQWPSLTPAQFTNVINSLPPP